MIQIDNIDIYGWEATIRGMRNPMNSWEKSDSGWANDDTLYSWDEPSLTCRHFEVGPNDHRLMIKLAKSGTEHTKYRRMINVTMDITAPLYWWKEMDTYTVGKVQNSCSTMHKITEKEFTMDDFSHEHLVKEEDYPETTTEVSYRLYFAPIEILMVTVDVLNNMRRLYLEKQDPIKKKLIWWQIIQLLPSSYNQKRTVQLNYEVLAKIYRERLGHKLDEWNDFCSMIKTLPYSKIITLKED